MSLDSTFPPDLSPTLSARNFALQCTHAIGRTVGYTPVRPAISNSLPPFLSRAVGEKACIRTCSLTLELETSQDTTLSLSSRLHVSRCTALGSGSLRGRAAETVVGFALARLGTREAALAEFKQR